MVWGNEMTAKVVWHVVKQYAERMGISKLAPHDLRRSCARLCHSAGGELEQIQFLLGHVSVQTTEKYWACKQRFREAVNFVDEAEIEVRLSDIPAHSLADPNPPRKTFRPFGAAIPGDPLGKLSPV